MRAPQPVEALRRRVFFRTLPLTTHEGDTVRFYDDLVRGKVVAINMMYAQCNGICPPATQQPAAGAEAAGRARGARECSCTRSHCCPSRTRRGGCTNTPRCMASAGLAVPDRQAPTTSSGCAIALGFYDPDPVVDGRQGDPHGHGAHRQRRVRALGHGALAGGARADRRGDQPRGPHPSCNGSIGRSPRPIPHRGESEQGRTTTSPRTSLARPRRRRQRGGLAGVPSELCADWAVMV